MFSCLKDILALSCSTRGSVVFIDRVAVAAFPENLLFKDGKYGENDSQASSEIYGNIAIRCIAVSLESLECLFVYRDCEWKFD